MDVRKISLGPVEIYMGSMGTTPTTYVGYSHDDCTIEMVYQNPQDYYAGIPQIPMERIPASRVITTVNFSTVEWDLEKFSDFLGLQFSSSTTQNILHFQDFDPQPKAMYLKHKNPQGDYIEVCLYKVVLARNFIFPFTYSLHKFPFSFEVLYPTVDFAGTSPTYLMTIITPRYTC